MNIFDVILYSSIAGAATLVGTWLVFAKEKWTKNNSIFLVSFAAGIMLTISFLHLIPESIELNPDAALFIFIGFIVFYILQQIIMFHPCHDETCHVHRVGILAAIGLIIHSLLDGIAIAAGFEAGWKFGLLTTLAVLLHEMPEGITITGILFHTNMKKKQIIIYSTLVALATPIGAIFSYFLIKNISINLLGMLLALTAGSFIYLAASDLLPETHKKHHRANALYFFIGVLLILGITKFLH